MKVAGLPALVSGTSQIRAVAVPPLQIVGRAGAGIRSVRACGAVLVDEDRAPRDGHVVGAQRAVLAGRELVGAVCLRQARPLQRVRPVEAQPVEPPELVRMRVRLVAILLVARRDEPELASCAWPELAVLDPDEPERAGRVGGRLEPPVGHPVGAADLLPPAVHRVSLEESVLVVAPVAGGEHVQLPVVEAVAAEDVAARAVLAPDVQVELRVGGARAVLGHQDDRAAAGAAHDDAVLPREAPELGERVRLPAVDRDALRALPVERVGRPGARRERLLVREEDRPVEADLTPCEERRAEARERARVVARVGRTANPPVVLVDGVEGTPARDDVPAPVEGPLAHERAAVPRPSHARLRGVRRGHLVIHEDAHRATAPEHAESVRNAHHPVPPPGAARFAHVVVHAEKHARPPPVQTGRVVLGVPGAEALLRGRRPALGDAGERERKGECESGDEESAHAIGARG